MPSPVMEENITRRWPGTGSIQLKPEERATNRVGSPPRTGAVHVPPPLSPSVNAIRLPSGEKTTGPSLLEAPSWVT